MHTPETRDADPGRPVRYESVLDAAEPFHPIPLERYYRAAEILLALASARRLAILDVLSRRGPLTLGTAIFEGGMRTRGALGDAAELEKLGLITVNRPTGRNYSCVCQITPSGRSAIGMMAVWAVAEEVTS